MTDRDRLAARLISEGKTRAEAASVLGVHDRTVMAMAHRAGYPRRRPGPPRRSDALREDVCYACGFWRFVGDEHWCADCLDRLGRRPR